MKLQVAIDRIPLNEAVTIANQLDGIVDIIELGTSLVKDYGLLAIKDSDLELNHAQLLLDVKTIDEGVYEFEKGYDAHADILTVMGASSVDTLTKVAAVAEKRDRDMFIDLMEIPDQKMAQITQFDNAIYGIHHSKDAENQFDAAMTTEQFHRQYPSVKRIAVAGGIDLKTAQRLADQKIAESVIVGSGILKADDPIDAAKTFMEVLHK